ncbi:AP endonuclease [Streptomyces lydicus]|uniref:AP endonuclease n=1 Tax=Streptomyces lydicus TaxID=47763 RepID=UPI00378B0FA2
MSAGMPAGGAGLYSIGVRDVSVPELLEWAGHEGLPFLHLRGGPRGYDLTRQKAATLRYWRQCAEQCVPITGVTADLDLIDLFAPSRPERAHAREELERLAAAAEALGATWVRLLGRTVPQGRLLEVVLDEELPQVTVPLLVELHHPGWLAPTAVDALEELLQRRPHLRLLADTAQLAAAVPSTDGGAGPALERVLDFARVLHLSDSGSGLNSDGHARVAMAVARRIAEGQHIEVAVEWTGQPRTAQECLDQYRAACRWWGNYAPPAPRKP